MKKPEIAEKLIDYIDAQIMCGSWPPGTRLPSVRTLANKFHVSYSSALRGIDFLASQGKVVKSAKRGNFTSTPNTIPGNDRRLGVILGRDVQEPGIFSSIFAVIRRLAVQYNYELQVLRVGADTPHEEILQLNECAGIFVMRELDAFFSELPLTAPAVGILLENDFSGRLSLVGLDPFNLASQAVKYFQRHGIFRVALVSSLMPIYKMRARIFAQAWEDAGGEIVGLRLLDTTKVTDFTGLLPNCGYFFTSDNVCYVCMQSYEEAHQQQLNDVAVILSADGKSRIMPWEKSIPTIAIDWKEIGHVAFYECMGRIKDPLHKPRRIYLSGTLTNQDACQVAMQR